MEEIPFMDRRWNRSGAPVSGRRCKHSSHSSNINDDSVVIKRLFAEPWRTRLRRDEGGVRE